MAVEYSILHLFNTEDFTKSLHIQLKNVYDTSNRCQAVYQALSELLLCYNFDAHPVSQLLLSERESEMMSLIPIQMSKEYQRNEILC